MQKKIKYIENFISDHDLLNDGFCIKLFQAALNNANDGNNPLRANNFAYALRELMRNILANLAPDNEISMCSWYKETDEPKVKITRAQRIAYAIHGGIDSDDVKEKLSVDVCSIQKKLSGLNNRLSKMTHIERETFNIPPDRSQELISESIEVVFNFLEAITVCNKNILSAISDDIDMALFVNLTIPEFKTSQGTWQIEYDDQTVKCEALSIRASSISVRLSCILNAILMFDNSGELCVEQTNDKIFKYETIVPFDILERSYCLPNDESFPSKSYEEFLLEKLSFKN